MITEPATAGGSCELDEPKEMAKRACYLQSCDRMSQGKSVSPPDILVGVSIPISYPGGRVYHLLISWWACLSPPHILVGVSIDNLLF